MRKHILGFWGLGYEHLWVPLFGQVNNEEIKYLIRKKARTSFICIVSYKEEYKKIKLPPELVS